MCIRKISGTIEQLWGEPTDALSVGTHRYSGIRFDEMRVVPVSVQPRPVYIQEPETGVLKLPETIKYDEEKDNGKSS